MWLTPLNTQTKQHEVYNRDTSLWHNLVTGKWYGDALISKKKKNSDLFGNFSGSLSLKKLLFLEAQSVFKKENKLFYWKCWCFLIIFSNALIWDTSHILVPPNRFKGKYFLASGITAVSIHHEIFMEYIYLAIFPGIWLNIGFAICVDSVFHLS